MFERMASIKQKFTTSNLFLSKRIFGLSFAQLANCKVSLIIYALFVISQPLVISLIYALGFNLVDYTLLITIIPLGISFIFISVTTMRLFSENRYNYIDSITIAKPIKRSSILLIRVSVIETLIFSTSFFHILYALFFLLAITTNSLLTAIFIADLLITPAISLIFIIICVLLSIKMKPTWFISMTISLSLCMTYASLITRPLIPDTNLKVTYENEDISFSKLYFLNGNTTYLVADIKDLNYIGSNANTYFGITSIGNYFIPSEWLIAFYSSLFAGFNYAGNDAYINHPYSLINKKFVEIRPDGLDVNENKCFMFRPNDIIPFELSTIEYEQLIMDNIARITVAPGVIDFSHPLGVDNFLEKLKTNFQWSDVDIFNETELRTLIDLFGINTDFNQMYYLSAYYSSLINYLPDIETLVIDQYGESVWNLLDFLWTSSNTSFVLSQNNVLNTGKELTDFYGTDKVYKDTKPILNFDKKFIRDDLIRYSGSTPAYYTNSGTWGTGNLATILKTYDASITDEQSWYAFVDKLALSLEDTYKFLLHLNEGLPKILDFKLSMNYTNVYDFSSFLEMKQTPFLDYSWLFIIIICASIPLLWWLTIYKFKRCEYNDI